ncbi:peptidoglycan DD-metalloendopeptidase family protein [Microvirga thermotolerans]|uniref:Peptidoglycan DD-metalloendopeptidase family protein n=1 Tax=Microvirga thermotolerans TaxID=2651334 RepID=A0A5P9JX14_9HYPH|nr:peptidoglycan DD-metalloendopeptidase family protein [Microvirga thermotolerans]QFU16288.1 peptidoglycan DD-metalloendopeptidase family protein [Microvirga thermotolerans]
MRFADNPFSNPFAASERFEGGAKASASQSQPQQVAAVPTAPVQSQALPPVQSQPLSQPVAQPTQMASAPVQGASGGAGGWSAAGGTAITVGSNDTLNGISQRYGVPANAILAASGLSSPAQVKPGQRLVIPVYNAGSATQVASAAPARGVAPAPQTASAQPKFRLVENRKAEAAPVEPAGPAKRVRPGMAVAKSEPATSPAAPAPVKVATAGSEPLVSAPKPVEPQQKVAAVAEPQPVKPAATPQPAAPAVAAAPAPQPAAKKEQVQEPEQTASLSEPAGDFRWPARGRVIAGFGANGGNEGINIAVPEGTPVKAAESGVVTYAGNEVKGYGNLVLIRHDNGYVSAYAHNGSLNVKRGEQVKRGQVIATSGQTGNVTSPQLHFEIRKGATPVDPLKYLGS